MVWTLPASEAKLGSFTKESGMNIATIGSDLAKNVFQIHGV